MKLKVIILLISLLSGSIEAQTIHYNAFSHNDYERPRPLFDALSFQFNCVEADLWLIDGELYVSHDSVAPNPDITFEKLYLLPLVERIKKNGGKVYPDSDRPFYLMVDCKTDGEAMYPVLKKKLKPYESLFCHEKDGKLQESAVLFYLSGKSPRKAIAAETNRFIFLDGTIEDLGKGIPAVLMPVISDNYSKYIGWKGQGEIPAEKLDFIYRLKTGALLEASMVIGSLLGGASSEEAGIMEQWGTGVQRVFDQVAEAGLPEPVIEEIMDRIAAVLR